ncbi:MAG: hypothetical protein H0X33_14020 [Taibaiella sp.]|nr:hypothetical protein [Taibaiella sp.]
MKRLLMCAALIIACTSCKKTDDPSAIDTTTTYTLKGQLISYKTKTPLVGKLVALAQVDTAAITDPSAMTDSNGTFEIAYHPNSYRALNLHPVYVSYQCVFTDINILENITKNVNVDLGAIYTSAYDFQ